PDARRAHPPAQLRRAPLPASRARRGPHGPRDDPDAPGQGRPPGHRRLHGDDGRHAPEGGRPRVRRARLHARARAVPRLSREGGVLRNSQGERFMFEDIPENYRSQTADTEEEGWRYVRGDKDARRPPELLTRDHVARCIVREIKAGRGSPHGGVFLDISWIK